MTWLRPAVVAVALASSVVGAQEGWRPVPLVLPATHGAGVLPACAADTVAPALRIGPGGLPAIEAICGRPAVVRCNAAGLEPLDIDLNDLCRGRSYTLTPTERSIVATWALRVPATVEWRGWKDGLSYLIATRRVDAQAVDPWPLSAELRLLRVLRPDASPVTFVIPQAAADPVDLTVTVPPAQPGGELLVALAESERQVTTLVVRGPETRVVGINGAPVVAISGLPEGDYEVVLGSLDVPLGPPALVRVVAGETIEMSSHLPVVAGEYRISGTVTLNGEPMRRQALVITHLQSDVSRSVTTDDRGRYSLTVDRDGRYVVRLALDEDLGHAESDATVRLGDNVLDLTLTGGDLDVAFIVQGAAPPEGTRINVTLDGPVKLSTQVTGSAGTLLRVLPSGTYNVGASAPPDLVAETMTVSIDGSGQTQRLLLDLRPQTTTLQVPGTPGVRARAGQRILRTAADDGVFDVRQIPPGTDIIARAPGRVPGCVKLMPGVAHVLALGADLAPVTFQFAGVATMRTPAGKVRLSSVDQCTIPLEEFEWRRVADGFTITNFPRGVPVVYESGGMSLEIVAPAGPVVVK